MDTPDDILPLYDEALAVCRQYGIAPYVIGLSLDARGVEVQIGSQGLGLDAVGLTAVVVRVSPEGASPWIHAGVTVGRVLVWTGFPGVTGYAVGDSFAVPTGAAAAK